MVLLHTHGPPRRHRKVGNDLMKTIELSQGKVTLVDDEDYRWLRQISWYAALIGGNYRDHWYAVTTDKAHHKMHRVIMRAPPGMVVDHIDGDGLNNQKTNLRIVSVAQNAVNRRKSKRARGVVPTSKFKGVNFYATSGRWVARIQRNRVNTHLGYFDVEEDAARAYDEAAKSLHGEFACLNFK